MAGFLRSLSQITRSVLTRTAVLPQKPIISPASAIYTSAQNQSSNYQPYPEIQTPSPFKKREKYRHGYKTKLFTGGVLPRPEGGYEDKTLSMPAWRPQNKDQWVQKKALFGQNDYIDILGDGSVQPHQLIKAPLWLKAFKGNELQRLTRRMKFEGEYLKEFYPTKYRKITKQIWFLYKRLNRRKHSSYYGSWRAANTSRIDRVRDF